jgi:hypothetical protein
MERNEKDREIAKLVNVLRRTARMAMQVEWTGGSQDAAAHCVEQYNRVLARLKELDPGLATVFEPLPAGSSLTVAAMACRQVTAYYEDRIDREPFKAFWCKSSVEFEDIGEFIRENLHEWARRRKQREEK